MLYGKSLSPHFRHTVYGCPPFSSKKALHWFWFFFLEVWKTRVSDKIGGHQFHHHKKNGSAFIQNLGFKVLRTKTDRFFTEFISQFVE
jgi:hypothetical protein